MIHVDDNEPVQIRPDPDKLFLYHRQQLSAMLDGELSPDEARFMLRRLQHDTVLAACWERWQVCGDVLRGQRNDLLPPISRKVSAAIGDGLPRSSTRRNPRCCLGWRCGPGRWSPWRRCWCARPTWSRAGGTAAFPGRSRGEGVAEPAPAEQAPAPVEAAPAAAAAAAAATATAGCRGARAGCPFPDDGLPGRTAPHNAVPSPRLAPGSGLDGRAWKGAASPLPRRGGFTRGAASGQTASARTCSALPMTVPAGLGPVHRHRDGYAVGFGTMQGACVAVGWARATGPLNDGPMAEPAPPEGATAMGPAAGETGSPSRPPSRAEFRRACPRLPED